jgi:peptidoglycan hydrolase-like protein with peptidoglycan-binding domain
MLSHKDMREITAAAFHQQFGREGELNEVRFAQAICGLETSYASTWKGQGVGSNNMGAVQKGGWTGKVFSYVDTHPNKDGSSTSYRIDFRWYDTPFAGVLDVIRVVYCAFPIRKVAMTAAQHGDVLAFSTALHTPPVYYEGFGATDAERVAHHHNAVLEQLRQQSVALGEPLPEVEPLPVIHPALLIGCKGPAVEAWQHVVGVKVDGDFGGATQLATRAWQHTHKLPETGVVTIAELITAGLAPAPTSNPAI